MVWGWDNVNRGAPMPKARKSSGGGGGNKGCGGKKKMFGALFAVIFAAVTGVAQISVIIQTIV